MKMRQPVNPQQPTVLHNPMCAGQLVNVMEHSGDPGYNIKPENVT